MTEAQQINMDLLDTPCQFCDAGIGEPCADDCEALEANWPQNLPVDDDLGYGDDWLREQPDERKAALMSALYRLPFNGSFLQPPNYRGRETDDWLGELGIWLDQYNQFVKGKIAQLENESRRAMALQFEKDVVRKFFGFAPDDTREQK